MAESPLRPRHVKPRPVGELVAGHAGLSLREPSVRCLVTGVSLDSRSVQPGDLYLARAGEHSHGIAHLDAALAAGAVAVLTDATSAARVPDGVAVIVADDPRDVAGDIAADIYGDPAQALLTIGVTGTNGKTTTAWLIDAGLRASGRHTGLIGTVATVIDGATVASVRTTPEAPDLHALLAVMVERGVTAVAMEVSSHALALGRVGGVRFDVAGFTNLSQDHLDFHGDMESYFAAKASLFTDPQCHRAVLAVDDRWGQRLAAETAVPAVTVAAAASAASADWTWTASAEGLRLRGFDGAELAVPVGLAGGFNLANAALAAVILRSAGVADAAISSGIGALRSVPGRMERIDTGSDVTVIVDYAHTPDAVRLLLAEARRLAAPNGRVVLVLGCGGDRDAAKRPLMGQVAAAGADVLVVTDDNPRSEDPAAIRRQMLSGTRDSDATILEIGDRRAAIEEAVLSAGSADVVVIAGKGHESGQEQAGVVTPFDDRAVARDALRHLDRATAEGPR